MPVKAEREYRNIQPLEPVDNEEYRVSGYASTFESYEMWEDEDGNKYYERIEPSAFDEADMSDVIMQRDHSGEVYCRRSNETLSVGIDGHGLKVEADMSKTSGAREMYEAIKCRMYDKMSFAFIVDADHYEKDTRTRVIDRIKKVFDVSFVSIPANPTTEIFARDYFHGEMEKEHQELMRAEEQRRKIRIMLGVTK